MCKDIKNIQNFIEEFRSILKTNPTFKKLEKDFEDAESSLNISRNDLEELKEIKTSLIDKFFSKYGDRCCDEVLKKAEEKVKKFEEEVEAAEKVEAEADKIYEEVFDLEAKDLWQKFKNFSQTHSEAEENLKNVKEKLTTVKKIFKAAKKVEKFEEEVEAAEKVKEDAKEAYSKVYDEKVRPKYKKYLDFVQKRNYVEEDLEIAQNKLFLIGSYVKKIEKVVKEVEETANECAVYEEHLKDAQKNLFDFIENEIKNNLDFYKKQKQN